MYEGLWKLVNKITDEDSAVSVYLSAAIIGWTLVVALSGMSVCYLLQIDMSTGITNSVCAGAYAGIIFGLFGGILFLQRRR